MDRGAQQAKSTEHQCETLEMAYQKLLEASRPSEEDGQQGRGAAAAINARTRPPPERGSEAATPTQSLAAADAGLSLSLSIYLSIYLSLSLSLGLSPSLSVSQSLYMCI